MISSTAKPEDTPHEPPPEPENKPSVGVESPHRRVLEAPSPWPSIGINELWRYRDLLILLVWRDISANYRQSIIGFGWALFKPILSIAVFTIVFSRIARLPSDGLPYPVFCLAGLLPWLYFSTSLTSATNSVVSSGQLLTKVYFPRLILPLAGVLNGVAEFCVQFLALLVLAIGVFGIWPRWTIILIPGLFVLCMVAALAVGLWFTAVNVKYRDVGQMVPFLVQTWMWLTPVVYPSSLIPPGWRVLYGLNPLTGIVEGFRWALFGTRAPDSRMMIVSFSIMAILFISGLYYFRRLEQTFSDQI
jgi:homopolymeric O-antigen transport system permease protein